MSFYLNRMIGSVKPITIIVIMVNYENLNMKMYLCFKSLHFDFRKKRNNVWNEKCFINKL